MVPKIEFLNTFEDVYAKEISRSIDEQTSMHILRLVFDYRFGMHLKRVSQLVVGD